MALVRNPVYSLTFSFEDRDKNTSTVGFYVGTGNTILEIETAANTYYIPDLLALSDATLKQWSVSSVWEEDSVPLAPETAEVQRGGLFSFQAANGAPFHMTIPSIRNTLVIDRSNIINASDPAVATFISNMLSSGPLALVRPRTYLGSDLRSFEKAVKRHRASTKG